MFATDSSSILAHICIALTFELSIANTFEDAIDKSDCNRS